MGGSHKAAELAEIADRTGGVAFVMYPTSMEDLMKIADENKLMPPKSTWFEPKLRSGCLYISYNLPKMSYKNIIIIRRRLFFLQWYNWFYTKENETYYKRKEGRMWKMRN